MRIWGSHGRLDRRDACPSSSAKAGESDVEARLKAQSPRGAEHNVAALQREERVLAETYREAWRSDSGHHRAHHGESRNGPRG